MARYQRLALAVSQTPLSNRTCGFPAYGLTMVFLMWRARLRRHDEGWPFGGASPRLLLPLPHFTGRQAAWLAPIAVQRSCRAFTEGLLAVSGMPSRLPRAGMTKAGSLPSSAFCCTPSQGLCSTSAVRPYTDFVAARFVAALKQTIDAPLWPRGSLTTAGACYQALQRLPGRDFHPQEERVFQDAP